jgi:hypothetical protein
MKKCVKFHLCMATMVARKKRQALVTTTDIHFYNFQYPSGINYQWIAGLFWGWCGFYLVCQISFITYLNWCLSSMVYVVYWGFWVVFVLYVRFSTILVFLSIYVIYTWNFVYSMYWFNVQHQFTFNFRVFSLCMFVCLNQNFDKCCNSKIIKKKLHTKS